MPINGIDLYHNFDSLKKLIGYVPQSDIVYNNLTLHDMLMYTAKLRLPKDTSAIERESAINRAIDMVELTEKKDSLIKSLSGGQRKRASIAVELLSDPNLLFLDEPASGLDPGTGRNLMQSLRKMSDEGKTVILVTHSTLQLKICDKIVFMGKGGNLCFYGSYDDALAFFGVSDIVDVYNMITDKAKQWSAKFNNSKVTSRKGKQLTNISRKSRKNRLKQLTVLSARYIKHMINDKQRLLLFLMQAPLLAVLISFVADGTQFEQYEMTKGLLFSLSCSAFWVGMLNSIQEICKERTIMKREYMTGLSLSAYILSKIVVLGVLCLIQSVLITGVFSCMQGTFTHELLGNFIGYVSDSVADSGLKVIIALASDVSFFSLFFIILFGYCTIKVIFANIKRGGMMLCQIAVGSLYLFGIPRGYTDGFYGWCKQVIATCLTAFLQTTILYLGLLSFTQHPLLAVRICLFATKVSRIAQMFGLDTSVKINMMSVSHTVSIGAKAVGIIKGKA